MLAVEGRSGGSLHRGWGYVHGRSMSVRATSLQFDVVDVALPRRVRVLVHESEDVVQVRPRRRDAQLRKHRLELLHRDLPRFVGVDEVEELKEWFAGQRGGGRTRAGAMYITPRFRFGVEEGTCRGEDRVGPSRPLHPAFSPTGPVRSTQHTGRVTSTLFFPSSYLLQLILEVRRDAVHLPRQLFRLRLRVARLLLCDDDHHRCAESALAYLFDSLNRFGNCRPISHSLQLQPGRFAARDLRPTRSTP